ncbi:MAG: methyltransferase domain-containing protein, partial [Nitrospirales bacterium]|nr:methyltransferase domain-containing protein [Nitrospirales bacterium]
DILCRNLASAGVLVKQWQTYRNGPVAATTLNANGSDYRRGYINLMRDQWTDWGKLTESVRSGRPVEDDTHQDDVAYRREFSWAMHHRSVDVAPAVAAQVDLKGVETLLDMGGGPGTYALEFLRRHPTLHATVADRAPALDVAREIAASVKHGRRLSYLPLDFLKDEISGRYDVIWFSNVLHIYSAKDNQRLFQKMTSALNPGGRVLIQDAFLVDPDGLWPQETNLFAVTMLLFTEAGNTYSVADTTTWLRKAGIDRVRPIPLKKGTGDWEYGLLEGTLAGGRRETRVRRSR